MDRIVSCINIFRPFVSILASLLSLVVYLSLTPMANIFISLKLIIIISLVTGYGFALNDYYDYKKDIIDHKDRAIPKGYISRDTVLYISIIICIISLLVSMLVNVECFLLTLFMVLLLTLYSPLNNKNGFISNIIVALLCGLLFLYGMLAAGKYELLYFLSSLSFVIYILGREILLDINDIASDLSIGKYSVPINLGVKSAKIVASCFLGVSVSINILLGYLFDTYNFIISISLLANSLIIVLLFFCWSTNSFHFFGRWSRVVFVLMLIGLL